MSLEHSLDAWIDVGGTFTDCFVRHADGKLEQCKVLSTGRVPLLANMIWEDGTLRGPGIEEAPGFWEGARLRRFDARGESQQMWRVVRSSPGKLTLRHLRSRNDEDAFGQSQATAPTSAQFPSSEPFHASRAFGDARWELDPEMEAPVLGVHRLLNVPLRERLPALRIRLGTTKGTNALLTRTGADVALAITSPFVDLLRIGDQTRPNLFDLSARKPPPLARRTLGINERLSADGQVLMQLDARAARVALHAARDAGCSSLAICLMHSYVNPEHEQALLELASEVGFEQVSCSSQLAPVIELVARAQTTVVDAYLSPVIRDYLKRLTQQFGSAKVRPVDSVELASSKSWLKSDGCNRDSGNPATPKTAELSPTRQATGLGSLHVMTSAGGLLEWRAFSGKDSILSGPAGGVSSLAAIREATSEAALIGLDMGGTSTDVCRVSDEHELQYESTKAEVRILTPTLPIETVASGGGSVCWFDGVSLRVGPQSAGALPGPACYGRGGPLTLTDLNVFLERIPDGQFPFSLDREAIAKRLDEILQQASATIGIQSRAELARGFRRLANEHMAGAVRTVTMAQGADARQHALVGFGGAAGQHICEIAELLGIERIYDSAEAGLLSALGMGLANLRLDATLAVYQDLQQVDWEELNGRSDQRTLELRQELELQGADPEELNVRRWLELRYTGTGTALTLPWMDAVAIPASFHAAHRTKFGYARDQRSIELVTVRIESVDQSSHRLPPAERSVPRVAIEQEIIARGELKSGDFLPGPAIVENDGSTLVIEADWQAECLTDGTLVLQHGATEAARKSSQPIGRPDNEPGAAEREKHGESKVAGTRPVAEKAAERADESDTVFRDCFAARLSAIATQMGLVLQQTSISVNIKQRRDYSCAIFDKAGYLLSSAPHVPVHLGAMGQTVRSILREFPAIVPGDSFITNDPYRGGSHLPDITVITPVFDDAHRLVMLVGSRAHHADVGGIAPGSMSVKATRLGDEGCVIPPMKLTEAGVDGSRRLIEILESSPNPPRNIAENLADIAAQQAANSRGIELLTQYAQVESWSRLVAFSQHVLSAAELRLKQFFQQQYQGNYRFTDFLDDDTPIQVSLIFREHGKLQIDFSGSGPISQRNFNANPSIVQAAVMYVLRCLVADEMPLNEGMMRAVDLVIPGGILNPPAAAEPADSPAVAAGNVETSQRVVDVLFGALGAAAASQGTMNNLLFGNKRFGFYETICGGAGATPKARGEDAVHTHMTNTRLTDPEVLEFNYPVRLTNFQVRAASGGQGAVPGGAGVIREIEFLEPVTVSLLTSRRGNYPPFGLDGGQAGKIGQNTLIERGERRPLDGCGEFSVQAGDRLEIQTPGGGGFGITDRKGK